MQLSECVTKIVHGDLTVLRDMYNHICVTGIRVDDIFPLCDFEGSYAPFTNEAFHYAKEHCGEDYAKVFVTCSNFVLPLLVRHVHGGSNWEWDYAGRCWWRLEENEESD